MKKRAVLYAEEGKILTNGEIYGTIIFLADTEDESTYYEITLEEYNAKLEAEGASKNEVN